MNLKQEFEQDPGRCRELRRTEQEIVSYKREADASFSAAMSEIRTLREERGQLKEQEKNLTIAIAGATVASGMRGAVGHAIGGGASSLTTERQVLRSRIQAFETQITQVQSTIDSSRAHQTRLSRELKQNADELRSWNCVR